MIKKILVAIVFVGVCTTIQAHSESKVCNFSTDYNIEIDSKRVLFSQANGTQYQFVGNQLLINDKQIPLTEKQQKASQSLQKNVRAMVPKIAEVAVEGAELGIKAATMVLTSLFGDDDPAMKSDLIAPIEELADHIKSNITKTTFNAETMEKSMDVAFNEKFEKLIETAVTKYSGKIVGNVLSSMFSGDNEEVKDLEFRMENLEQDIEKYVEKNAEEIELKANALCGEMVAIEAFDRVLESVEGYPENGLFQKNGQDGFNIKGFSFND